MIYLLDSNTISDLIVLQPTVRQNFKETLEQGDIIAITAPVVYEIKRGLLWRNSPAKLNSFENILLPILEYIELEYADWLQAAQFWADTVKQGRQLSDIDLLLGAMAYRRDAIIVTSDNDFNILPIKQVNWRTTS